MYKLIRRISNSFFPRPDRPWNEDATSNAPQIGRKRRLSEDDRDDDMSGAAKKHRGDSVETSDDATQRGSSPIPPGKDTEEVKEVTQGVREVELDDRDTPSDSIASEATVVPLPESPTLKATSDPKAVEEPSDALPLPEAVPETDAKALQNVQELEGSVEARSAEAESAEVKEDTQAKVDGQDEEEEVPGLSVPPAAVVPEPETTTTDDTKETKETSAQQDTPQAP
ncbi:hypothetical protein CERSUDRAFT_114904 [Gelatoporia subvermispora B]|uniref:Uncharacterized protein n=1 Tax=Ceriporiopsis subvermispora (strain B) TaxID=914234 RepID=M2QJ03_CERS8|nr:hypothetical protein CERSUDRAFT_114904 [Gelatoporia subvermispora B]